MEEGHEAFGKQKRKQQQPPRTLRNLNYSENNNKNLNTTAAAL